MLTHTSRNLSPMLEGGGLLNGFVRYLVLLANVIADVSNCVCGWFLDGGINGISWLHVVLFHAPSAID